MDCPICGADTVVFDVPADLRAFAPEEADRVGTCRVCLSTTPAPEADPDGEFTHIIGDFPEGEAGVAMALAVGLIVDSLALNRREITTLFERVSDGGTDPWLLLERLAVAGSVETDTDLERARRQLEQLSE